MPLYFTVGDLKPRVGAGAQGLLRVTHRTRPLPSPGGWGAAKTHCVTDISKASPQIGDFLCLGAGSWLTHTYTHREK